MEFQHKEWKGKTDGLPWMQRFLISWSRHFGVRSLYLLMGIVVPFYMMFNHRGYLAIYHYFRNRMGFSPMKSFMAVYRNHYLFGQVVLDRFSVYAGKGFRFHIENKEEFDRLCSGTAGFILLSAHIGNYELAGYSLKAGNKEFCTLVFPGETETVMKNRAIAFGRNNISMVPVKEDMSHVFMLNDVISRGGIASMPADRIFGSNKSVVCKFLGAEAEFPVGPFAFAACMGVPVIGISVMKESNEDYRIFPCRLDTEGYDSMSRERRIQLLAESYARYLEMVLMKYPEQWFNYFEFWREGDGAKRYSGS